VAEQEKTTQFSSQLRERLATIERRDWELWTLALVALATMTVGLVMVLVPAFFTEDRSIHLSATVTPEMLVGIIFVMGMFLIYLVKKQLQLRTTRLQSINETWNYEVAHVQMLMDPLTRVFNRSALNEMLSKEIKRAQRNRTMMAFLYVDVDDFKNVNTRHGHLFGDLVLAEVGGILKGSIRGSDFVVRMGGDEFLLALVETNGAGGEIVKKRVLSRVGEWNRTSPMPSYQLSLSCGVQEFDPSSSFDDALATVDMKMYVEKNAAKSR
jgi:diguanylate cyclase (GGDEF)-like protein